MLRLPNPKQLLFLSLLYHLVSCTVTPKRKKLVALGDFMIGALVPVHEQPSLTSGSKKVCGLIRDQYGVQRVEALLYMLDKINNKSQTNLLQGVKLGLEIRDECWETSIALEETIDFIKDTISEEETENRSIDVSNYSSKLMCSQLFKSSNKEYHNRIIAVIGPGGSGTAINVQNLLQLFDIPQIGYSATSKDLSDKNLFRTFLRVTPSDNMQVRAMIDVVVRMKWSYLFAIYTAGSYGQNGMETFRMETKVLNVCLLGPVEIRDYASDKDYEAIILNMNITKRARVIVCFCYGKTIRGLLGAIHRLNLKGRFIILGSDGWSDRIDVAQDYYEEAVGSLSIKAYSPLIKEFDDYFIHLNPSNNVRNVWFEEYWQERFKCYLAGSPNSKYTTPCEDKCPLNFISIGNECYHFSNVPTTWHEANQQCSTRNSRLINILDTGDIEPIHTYLMQNDLVKVYNKTHVKLEHDLLPFNNTRPTQEQSKQIFNFNKERLKLRLCKSTVYDPYFTLLPNAIDNSQVENSREEVFTFYNSKSFKSDVGCIILNLRNNTRKRLSYCLDLDKCGQELPYICKLKKDITSQQRYYKHSLENYQQDPKMSYIMNAFLAVVYGLNNAQKNYCKGPELCDALKQITGNSLLNYIRNSSFIGMANENIYFDKNADPPGRYVILNVQRKFDKGTNLTTYEYKEVGSWNNMDKLSLNLNEIEFNNGEKTIKSLCSEPCKFGHVKVTKQDELKCCWSCKKCENYSYVLDDFTCQDCDSGYWPNKNLTGCEILPLVHLVWNDPAPLSALFISTLGIVINTVVTHTFIKYSNTSVVKATTRELSFIILIGAYLAFLITIPLVLKPSTVTCCLSRILPGLSLSLMYGALMTKTNRISRIFSRSKKKILTKKLRFMSITAQIGITGSIIAIECALIFVGFILEPEITIITYPARNKAQLQCYNSIVTILGPLGYNIFIVILCTLYAVKTRNFPENFNEAKFIGFSMYTTCVIWIAFIPLYFASDFKVITLSLSMSMSATVLIVFLFVPKVYIILFEPHNNQRSAFITSKELRYHFGSNPTKQNSSNAQKDELSQTIEYPKTETVSIIKSFRRQPKQLMINQSCQTSLQSVVLPLRKNCVTEGDSMVLKETIVQRDLMKNLLSNSQLSLNKGDNSSCSSLSSDSQKNKTCNYTNEDSLENFRSLFHHDKLTLNWDFVQSSDYL